MPGSFPPVKNAKRFLLGGAVALVAVIALFVAGTSSYFSANRWVDHTLQVQRATDEWLAALLNAEAGARGYVIAPENSAFVRTYEAGQGREREVSARLLELVADNPLQTEQVRVAQRHARTTIDHQRELFDLVRTHRLDEAIVRVKSGDSTRDLDALRDAIDRISEGEALLLVERSSTARMRAALALSGGALLSIASIVMLVVSWRIQTTRENLLDRLARESRTRLLALSDMAVALSEARSRADVAAVIVDHGVRACGADTCTLYALDESGLALELIGDRGVASENVDKIRRITESSGNPDTFATLESGTTYWAETESDYLALFSNLAKTSARGPRAKAFWGVPLIVEGGAVGLLEMGYYESRTFSSDERTFIETLTKQCAQALVRATRLEREKSTRLHSEFFAKAGEALASSLDHQATLATVARIAVPTIADWCVVELIEPGTNVPRQVAVAHVDPGKVRFAKELGERYPPDPNASRGTPQVIRSGKSELYPAIPTELLERSAVDAEHLRMIRELHLESAMVVPLRARGRTLGAMTFVYAGSGRRYDKGDLAFVEDFARRAALAIDNSFFVKEAEASRAREQVLRNQAETASRAKDEFLAMVSHELRTPLTAILGWAVTLRGRAASPDIDRALGVIERNARAQAKLIDDVLDVSRIVSGNLALALGPTNVAQTVAAAIETVTPAADAKNIFISTDIADPSLTITADAERMQQVVWNLLSNAVKFTPKGGKVTIEVRLESSEVVIRVVDTGEGIRGEVLPVVFEPFKQADASPTRRHGGLGLGLAIAKQLVSAHGGTITAESEGENRGATFTVRIPARSAVLAVTRTGQTRPKFVPPAGRAPRLDGLRIIVIDDEEDALQLVGEVLRERGAEVHCVATPAEAVAKVTSIRPDVIVSDIGMPLLDGYALIRRIRALPVDQGGRTPAVALTAYARTEDAQRAFAAGYQMHVAKPVEPLQLATVVANLGGRSLDDGPSSPS
jgi:signal transduction histidine kinase/CHASE3 domain sensor protein/ActR/RegA family two-component response regulator